jgi:hypothetical protein
MIGDAHGSPELLPWVVTAETTVKPNRPLPPALTAAAGFSALSETLNSKPGSSIAAGLSALPETLNPKHGPSIAAGLSALPETLNPKPGSSTAAEPSALEPALSVVDRTSANLFVHQVLFFDCSLDVEKLAVALGEALGLIPTLAARLKRDTVS